MLSDLIYRVRALLRRERVEDELDEELQQHLEREAAKYERLGSPPEEARRRARLALGGLERVKEECRDARGTRLFDELAQDLRYGARQLRLSPGFALVAILSLTLGIGANTAIFQLLNAVRMRTLPVPRPQELVEVRIAGGNNGMGVNHGRYGRLTVPIWEKIRHDHPAFSGVVAWSANVVRVGPNSDLQRANGLSVSGEFFNVLGVPALIGRTLVPSDELATCPSTVALVSHGYWQRVLGGRDVGAGITLRVNGEIKQVVGVTPPSFFGLAVGESFDIAQPFCRPKELRRNLFSVTVMGRLSPGWTLDRATRQLDAASPRLFEETAITGYSAETVERYRRFRLEAADASTGVSWLRSTYDSSLWLLLGITGLVLLMACANLANLLLARASAREREVAVRAALGASRGRLARQLLVESAMLAVLGTAAGLWTAQFLSRMLVDAISVGGSTVTLPAGIDWRVLMFAAAAGMATCLVFGMAPALRAARAEPVEAMKAHGRGVSSSRDRLLIQRILVVTQVAVSLVLLVGAFLFVRSFRNLTTFDPGMRVSGITIAYMVFPGLEGPPEKHEAFQRQVVADIRALPGVIDAATTTTVPLLGYSWGHEVQVGTAKGSTRFTWVSPGYFNAMNIPVIQGRNIDESDTRASRRVAVVNEAFVRTYTGTNPIGRTMRTSPEPGYPATEYEIVGVIRDTQYDTLRGAPVPMTFAPASQAPQLGAGANMMIYSDLPPATVLASAKKAIVARYPNAMVEQEVLETQIYKGLMRERLMAMLSGFFGALAALLATIGLYGLISYLVARRRNEIGVRLALGARPMQVIRMIVGDAGRLLVSGLAIGVVLALAAGRAAGSSSLLFGLTPHDPATLAGACALLAAIAAAASVVPARRAATLDALVALRHE